MALYLVKYSNTPTGYMLSVHAYFYYKLFVFIITVFIFISESPMLSYYMCALITVMS